jgi:hypothetical protein
MNFVKQIASVSLLLLLMVTSLSAVTHEVYQDSGLSIQTTVLAASNGDSIIIHDGEYTESVVIYGRGLFIGSEFVRDGDTTHIANTIIHADTTREDTMSCFVYAYGEHPRSKISGLTLMNGRGTYSIVSNSISGGGVYIYNSSIQIESCLIENCSAYAGGGISIRSQVSSPHVQELTDCTVRNCSSISVGGGFAANRCSLYVERCNFEGNTCEDAGAGADVNSSFAILRDCLFRENNGFLNGGLVYAGCSGSIEGCVFLDNSCDDLISHFVIADSDALITGCLFGPAVSHSMSIALLTEDNPLRFFGNIVEYNINTYQLAGTILIAMRTTGEFAYNIVRNNYGNDGCTINIIDNSDVVFHHNVITNNVSGNPEMPSVLFAVNDALPSIDSNIIQSNSGQTILYDWWQPHVIDARNNWWGDESGPYHPSLNPEGQGDTLYSDMVLFIPWLTSPPDTTMPNSTVDPERPEMPGTWRIMNLFPNPFNSEFTIILAGFTRGDFSIRLYDILGREAAVIHEGALTGGRLSFRAPTELASGVYFLRAADKTQIDTRKVIFLK